MAAKTKLRANQLEIEEILNYPSAFATELKAGTLRIATQAEVDAGTATDLAVTPATLAGSLGGKNWIYANDGDNFPTAPQTSGTYAITIGHNSISYIQGVAIGSSVTAQQNSVSIGLESAASGFSAVALGHLAKSVANYQVSIGYNMPAGSPEYAVRIGYAQPDANLNYLRLRNQGQFEIFGNQAQFVMPSYNAGGSPALPTNAIEGGLVYDANSKSLQLYNGTGWNALSGLFSEDAQSNIVGGSNAGSSLLATGNNNFLAGVNAGDSITSGDKNVAVGNFAGANITTASFNTAVGNYAMHRTDAFASGDFNVAIGHFAGRTIRSSGSDYNVFIGANCGSNTTATGGNVNSNVFIGGAAGTNVRGGAYSNIGIGRFVMTTLTTGDNNIAIGQSGFRLLDTGSNNTAFGYRAGYFISGASSDNVVIGAYAGPTSSTVESNKLYINNAATATPLIGGTFANVGSPASGQVIINGELNPKGVTRFADGTLAQPSITFEANIDGGTGITSNGVDGNIYFTNQGNAKFFITSAFNGFLQKTYFPVGSAGAPSIAYNADPDTGLYFATNEVHISTGGVNRLGVLNDGSLSVAGTTNYETLVTNDDDIPNKKYVDDAIGTGIGASTLNQLLDVSTSGSPVLADGHVLTYSTAGSPPVWKNLPTSDVGLFSEDANRNVVGGTGTGASLTSGTNNFIAGFNAGDALDTGSRNILIGNYSGTFITNGVDNVVIGFNAISDNDTSSADRQTIVGAYAGRNVSGSDPAGNIILGFKSAVGTGLFGGTGGGNFFAGYNTAQAWQAAHDNVAIGELALNALNNGSNNIAIGKEAGDAVSSAVNNVFLGPKAGFATTGSENIFIGAFTGQSNTSGYRNIAFGRRAGTALTTGNSNICIGYEAGPLANTSDQLFINTFQTDDPLIHGTFAPSSGSPLVGASVTINGVLHIAGNVTIPFDDVISVAGITNYENLVTADDDIPNKKYVDDAITVGVGAATLDALLDVTLTGSPAPQAGDVLTYSGVGSPVTQWVHQTPAAGTFTLDAQDNIYANTTLSALTTGQDNFAAGVNALTSVQGGQHNVAIGEATLTSLTSGFYNIAIGLRAGEDLTTGSNNIGFGYASCGGLSITTPTGSNNTAVGGSALFILSGAASGNTALGTLAGRGIYTSSNNTMVGFKTGDQTSVISGSGNTLLGAEAGQEIKNAANNNTLIGTLAGALFADGDANVCLGYGAGPATGDAARSNTLWINNSQSDTPLIHGDFAGSPQPVVTINGDLLVTGSLTGGVFELNDLNDVALGSPLTTNEVLTYNGSSWVNQTASGGSSTPAITFLFDTATSGAAPAAGYMRYSTTSPLSTVHFNFSDTTQEGLDVTRMFGNLNIGDQIYIVQEDDDTVYAFGTVDGHPVVGTGQITVPVFVGTGFGSTQPAAGAVMGIMKMPGKTGSLISAAGTDTNNIFIGTNSGNVGAGGTNICIGTDSGTDLGSGATVNICIGHDAGRAQVSGDRTIAIGDRALGNSAVSANARDYVFIGRQAGFDAVAGSYHSIAIGTFASRYENGQQNTFIGPYSGCQNVAGNSGSLGNVGVGRRSLNQISSGDENVAVGTYAGKNITTGSGNVCIGKQAGPTTNVSDQLFINSDTAASNTPLIHGEFAGSPLPRVTINGDLIVTGTLTGGATGGGPGSPAEDVVLDQYANIVGGSGAGASVTATAVDNIILGKNAGNALAGGKENVFAGFYAGANSVNGSYNVCIGKQAGQNISDVFANIGIGNLALGINSVGVTGNYNIGIGQIVLGSVTGGGYNVAIGNEAGDKITTGNFNICIGEAAGPTTNQSNQLFIDRRETDTPLIHGTFSTTAGSPAQNGAAVTINGDLTVKGTTEFTAYNEKGISYGTIGSIALDTSAGTYFYPTGTTTGSITFSFTNPASGSPVAHVTTFALEMLGAANNAPVWPGSVTWANGVEPTWTTGTDIVSFFTRDGGTTWYGSAVILNDATIDLNNADILNARSITFNSEVTITPSGSPATATADWTAGQKQKITITEATTVSFTSPLGQSNLTLKLINGGTGTITWPGAVKWASSTEPSWTTTGTDIVSFYFDGTNYYGMAGLAFA